MAKGKFFCPTNLLFHLHTNMQSDAEAVICLRRNAGPGRPRSQSRKHITNHILYIILWRETKMKKSSSGAAAVKKFVSISVILMKITDYWVNSNL